MPVIMESWTLYYLTLFVHMTLYIVAPVWLFRQGWPITGGLIMVASTILPIGGQTWFTDSESPAFGLLIIVELPLAVIVLLIGVLLTISRLVGMWRLEKRSP